MKKESVDSWQKSAQCKLERKKERKIYNDAMKITESKRERNASGVERRRMNVSRNSKRGWTSEEMGKAAMMQEKEDPLTHFTATCCCIV